MNKTLAVLAATIVLVASGCGTQSVDLTGSKTFEGPFFTIKQPEGFKTAEISGGFALTGNEYGIAIIVTKNGKYREGNDDLSAQGTEFLNAFKDGKVEQTRFAGFPALYLESTSASSVSFGYTFMLDGALVNINASMIPEKDRQEAAAILASFVVTKKDLFKPDTSSSEITQFGPSEGEPIQIDTVMLIPPKGWRILDNSTPDYISIEPKETNTEDAGMGINILTLTDEKSDPQTIANKQAQKAETTAVAKKYGQIDYWHFMARYQQTTFVFVTKVGEAIRIVSIKTPEDEMGSKMEEFMSNLAFKKK